MGDSTGRTAFSNPMVYILSFTLSKSGPPRFCISLICLLITGFSLVKFVLRFLPDRNWCTELMLPKIHRRTFFSEPKQCVLLFSLPKADSPCFAALLNNIFQPDRFSLLFLLDRKVVLLYFLLLVLNLSLTMLSVPFDPKLVGPLYRFSTSDLSLLEMALCEPFGHTLSVLLSRLFRSFELLRFYDDVCTLLACESWLLDSYSLEYCYR